MKSLAFGQRVGMSETIDTSPTSPTKKDGTQGRQIHPKGKESKDEEEHIAPPQVNVFVPNQPATEADRERVPHPGDNFFNARQDKDEPHEVECIPVPNIHEVDQDLDLENRENLTPRLSTEAAWRPFRVDARPAGPP